ADSGNVNVVAGWDSVVAALANPLTDIIAGVDMHTGIFGVAGSFGKNNGSVTISNATGAAAVGSRFGETNVAAYDVTLTGTSGGLAQIGYFGAGDGDGDIRVKALDKVSLQAGDKYDQAHAQIGHGGYQVVGNKGGDITVEAGNGVTLTADQVGTGRFGGAQIGHGGRGATSQPNNYEGAITVDGGAGPVDLVAGLTSGSQDFRYAQIGHGGPYYAWGNFEGDIRVTGSDVNLASGARTYNYARIGHGGWTGEVNTGDRIGDIYVGTPGEISIQASPGGGVAVIGHHKNAGAGTIHDANVTIEAASMDHVFGGSGGDVFEVGSAFAAMMMANLVGGDISLHATGAGGLLVNSGGSMVFTSANDFNFLSEHDVRFQGSVQNRGDGNINVVAGWDPAKAPLADPATGIIADVDLAGDLLGVAGSYGNHYAAVVVDSSSGPVAVGSARGATTVVGHAVEVLGSDTAGGGYAQIGAAPTAGVSPTGAIAVLAKEGGVNVKGGGAASAYAQIGHRSLGATIPALSGGILVDSLGGLVLSGGAGLLSSAQIGHGGNSGDVGSIGGAV
ncbi:MAG TPA: hypothetical protein PLA50_06605, partial [Bacteroidia bacterium]|nr:hypothetical protein [Bacteroidia bacterium]